MNRFAVRSAVACALAASLAGAVRAGGATPPQPPVFTPYRHPVTIWVPPYAVVASTEQLNANFGGAGVSDGITHLALQFWVPTKAGTAALINSPEVKESAILALRDWGHAHGIRVLLCVFNGAETWDWPLARTAFANHPAEFATSLVAEADRLGLDGVDVDLEGDDQYDADRGAFVAFLSELSRQLHSRSKHLTVDSFPSAKWNAPNQSWWPSMFPLVDALTTMGYDGSGSHAPDWGAYAAQRKAAGSYAAKLQIGVPSDKDAWQGDSALTQLHWISQDGSVGVGIWDAQLPASVWRTAPVWQALRGIRSGGN